MKQDLSLFFEKDTPNQNTVIQEQGVSYDQRIDMVDTGYFYSMQTFMEEGNVNFGQMKLYMNETHPNLDNQELNEWYKGLHGTGGSSESSNFREMGSMF